MTIIDNDNHNFLLSNTTFWGVGVHVFFLQVCKTTPKTHTKTLIKDIKFVLSSWCCKGSSIIVIIFTSVHSVLFCVTPPPSQKRTLKMLIRNNPYQNGRVSPSFEIKTSSLHLGPTLCGARWLSGRMPDSQSREPGFESPLIPFRSLDIFFHFTTPQSTQLYK